MPIAYGLKTKIRHIHEALLLVAGRHFGYFRRPTKRLYFLPAKNTVFTVSDSEFCYMAGHNRSI